MAERKDQEWVRALKAQDPATEQALWQALFAWATALVRRQHIDEDVAMEGMVAAYTRIINRGVTQYAFRGPFLGFCRQILVNEIYRSAKKQQRTAANIDDMTLGYDDPLSQVDDAAMYRRLQPCLERLNPRERALIDWFYFDDKDPETIADELGITRNYVHVTIHRTRRKLQACLQKAGYYSAADLFSL